MNYLKLTVFVFLFQSSLLLSTKEIFVSSNLKEAIAKAEDGDKVIIKKGFYSEGEIIVNKSISIIGLDYPIISGNFKTQVFLIKAPNVYITGIEVANTGVSYVQDIAGIKLDNVKYCKIENCKISKCLYGIYLLKSTNCIIKNNILNGSGGNESLNGNGIHNWYCKDNLIENNQVYNHRDGLYFEFSSNCRIFNNLSNKNLRYGLHFMFSHSNHFENNTFRKNGAGVAVMYSHNVKMIHNRFEDNWGSASYGMLLKDISYSTVKDNIISNNTIGVYLEGGGRNHIEHNNISKNGWALKLMVSSENNYFLRNSFIANSFDISTNGNYNTTNFTNNYWDKYSGYDLNRDGIGDIPYHPVSLFSVIVEKNPSFVLLLNSFFINLLDLAEHLMPIITPEAFIDSTPILTPIL